MAGEKDQVAPEVVIVRRKAGGEDEHHHGGVWKIAYADFMTAMMAFFLVMWLINAANTETKARIASYFNPIKLTDNSALRKGLRDPAAKPDAISSKAASTEAEKPGLAKDQKGAREGGDDGAARSKAAVAPQSATGGREELAADAVQKSGLAYRDPFNPLNGADVIRESRMAASEQSGAMAANDAGRSPIPGSGAFKTEAAVRADKLTRSADEVRRQAEAAISRQGLAGGPGIDVTVEGDAIVIGLTDTATFGMFAIGSAEPGQDLLKLLQAIAPLVSANSDRIIVRGHTDARRWKSLAINNNWRLSMSRAETAYALLVGAGIDDRRFERIEAHAERRPKVPGDPQAAANRRIEILLKKGSP